MIAVIQRVKQASVTIDGKEKKESGKGILILVGIEDADNQEDIEWLSRKIVNLRIFDDQEGVMNLSLPDVSGDILLVSQFTLHASVKKGNRPSYIKAAKPDIAIPLYENFKAALEDAIGKKVTSGKFGSYMEVGLINDGPVTIIIDTKNKN